jgi:flagellar biosynthesis regulator FlaF
MSNNRLFAELFKATATEFITDKITELVPRMINAMEAAQVDKIRTFLESQNYNDKLWFFEIRSVTRDEFNEMQKKYQEQAAADPDNHTVIETHSK